MYVFNMHRLRPLGENTAFQDLAHLQLLLCLATQAQLHLRRQGSELCPGRLLSTTMNIESVDLV